MDGSDGTCNRRFAGAGIRRLKKQGAPIAKFDLAPEKRLPRPMMYDFGNGSKLDEEIADGLHA
jgi:hypothetical protein